MNPHLLGLESSVIPLYHTPNWYTTKDSNFEPAGYKPDTLTVELVVHIKVDSRALFGHNGVYQSIHRLPKHMNSAAEESHPSNHSIFLDSE